MKWLTFENRYLIQAELVAQTGLRIGAGGTETAIPTATDLLVIRTVEGTPFIPGSSLRGVLRGHVERIVRTFENQPGNGKGACNPTCPSEWCIPAEERRELVQKSPQEYEEQIYLHSCRVCRVFGSPWFASRIRIADLPLLTRNVEPELRDSVAIDREKESVANKFDFEALPAGVRFRLDILAENLDDEEMGLLLLGLRELEAGNILVGGFKGRGLGRVCLESLTIKHVKRENLKRYLIDHTMDDFPETRQQECLNALFRSLGGGE